VRAIMSDMGKAMMGTGEASGEKRALEAAEAAISNPLLDDVSMRGARGLLISITGGPDLTLYEIDEAATRIREEVDAEANIILGATFDETLEGTMRVSVVATGLAEEAAQAAVAKSGEEYDTVSGRLVYGFSGTRVPEPAVEQQPAAAAPQHQAAPQQAAQQAGEPAAQPSAATAQAGPGEAEQVIDTQPRAQKMAPRMPRPDEFPPIAQRQMQAHQAQAAGAEPKKRRGLIERLASVGLGRREAAPAASRPQPQPAPAPAPVAEQRSEPRMQAIPEDNRGPQQAGNVHTITPPNAQGSQQGNDPAIDPGLDDDQLEIPAFLRRQAN
ncbi:MAG TPA: cell division protein FtsZ, partial [Aestuariivirgaceae bacterium]|nr:cell division protein FtsZ [Aestuariivirgaceae bacterium]